MKRFDEQALREFIQMKRENAEQGARVTHRDISNNNVGRIHVLDEILYALDQGKFHVERVKAKTEPNGLDQPA